MFQHQNISVFTVLYMYILKGIVLHTYVQYSKIQTCTTAKITYKGVNTQSAMESVWWIQNRVYSVLPEEALSIRSKAIPGKKIHHVQQRVHVIS